MSNWWPYPAASGPCGHCGMTHAGMCPRIKSIEYNFNGTIKRVEYHDQRPINIGDIKCG